MLAITDRSPLGTVRVLTARRELIPTGDSVRIRPARTTAVAATAVLVAGLLTAPSAAANPAGSGLVINEVYLNGGSAGATYLNKFVELGNPTPAPITLAGLSLQYRATGATSVFGQVQSLDGTVPAGGTYLIQLPANSTNGAALPDPDAVFTLNPSGTAGAIALAVGAAPLTGVDGSVTANPAVVDLVGWGPAAKSYETAVPAGPNGVTASLNRTGFADTDSNAADFTAAAPTPTPSGGTEPEPEPEPVEATIAEIQGTGDASPLVGRLVTTTGVVTAAYPTGGFNGFYLQTGGSGGDPADDLTPGASDGVFVFGSAVAQIVHIGDSLQVTGTVSEFSGLTEMTPATTGDVVAIGALPLAKSTEIDLPATTSARESLEGMLLHPAGTYTVTDVFSLNNFASIGLAFGEMPLKVPTEVAAPGPDADAVAADNAAHKVVLDDGSSVNYLGTGAGAANKNIPLPWLTDLGPIRVGYAATFTGDVIFDYRNAGWNFQPVAQLTAGDINGVRPVTFAGERPAAPEPVGGDIKLGTFNVLNYFTTTGAAYEAATGADCTSFDDRAGNPIGVNSCTGDAGPRGAWDDASLARQQVKIVTAINELGADVVSLEEIENSAQFGIDRDTALAALVAALNAAAGAGTWEYVASPEADDLPPIDEQDVIRTGFIYKPAVVTPVGASTVLTGSAAFADAREPLAQAFTPVAGRASDTFLVIVNHFKSKGSGVDDHTGQGLANPDRIAQAHALVDFADAMTTTYGTDRVFLTGDFNAYSKEDPVQVLKDAGYLDLEGQFTDKETYSFGGESGSLDHVFASPAIQPSLTGLDVWQINGEESIAYEYSRYNYNATLFYADDVYRSSDHDPVVLGLDVQAPLVASTTTASVAPVSYGTAPAVSVTVTAAGTTPTGTVTVSANGQPLGSASLSGGAATVSLPADLTPGSYPLLVSYEGSDTVAASETSVQLEVRALPSVVVAVAIPPIVRSGQGTTVYAVAATNAGVASGGTVQVYLNGTQLASAPVGAGVARVPLPAFSSRGLKLLTVSYTGTDTVAGSATVVLVLVR